MQMGMNGSRKRLTDAPDIRNIFNRSFFQSRHRTEMTQKHLDACRAQSGDLTQDRRNVTLPPGPLMRDREAMGFVTDALEQEEGVAVARQDDRVVGVWQPDLFQTLGDATELDSLDARIAKGPGSGRDLRLATIDDEQVGAIAELLAPGLRLSIRFCADIACTSSWLASRLSPWTASSGTR